MIESESRIKIKSIDPKDLQLKCVDLLMKTYTELGQTPSEQMVIIMSQSLSEDLKSRFPKLDWYDVERAFHRGVRETDDFHLNVKTYFKWLTFWKKQVIWDAEHQLASGKKIEEIPYFKDKGQIKLLK